MHDRTPTLVALLFATAALGACGGSPAGREAYGAGRYADAARAFAEAAKEAGDGASADLLHDLALASVRAGDLRAAEEAADAMAARGGAEEKALSEFLRGLASFARAEADAARPGADRLVRDRAVAHADAARGRFERAAASRDDWPEARRNAERAALLLRRLLRDREVADARRKEGAPPPGPGQPPPPPPPPPEAPSADPSAPPPGAADGDLPRDRVLELLRRLQAMEEEKAALRRARRAQGQAGVEKDW